MENQLPGGLPLMSWSMFGDDIWWCLSVLTGVSTTSPVKASLKTILYVQIVIHIHNNIYIICNK